jgi:cobalt/nickel transport system permease protein
MHIPDGFLQPSVAVVTAIVSVVVISAAVRKTTKTVDDYTIPVIGVIAAFIFVAQMIQFPVAPGISGHLLGGALAAILMGPWIGSLVITTVLIIQCLVFQDGGLLALGANILNMAIIGVFSAHIVYQPVKKLLPSSELYSVFAASLLSVLLTAAAAGVELSVSGAIPFVSGMVFISGVHLLIGLCEAFATVMIVSFIMRTCPEYFKAFAKAAL